MWKTRSIAFLCVVTCALLTSSAYAAAGALDGTFGSGGKVVTDFGNDAIPTRAALQSDAKILVMSGFDNTTFATEAFGVVRYLPTGRLDTTFGSGGRAMTSFTNFINSPNSLALQEDGKIVIAGEAQSADGTLSEFALARFNSNGTLDNSFGAGGKVTTNFVGVHTGGVSNPANAVVVQPDLKIVAGGVASLCEDCVHFTALARYNPNGSLDSTFGTGGKVSVSAIGPVQELAVLANGHILALNGSAIVEFDANGRLQSNVTSGRIVAASTGGTNAFQSDSKFLLASAAAERSRHDVDVKLARFTPTGAVDATFNSPLFDFGTEDFKQNVAQAVAVQSNGKIVAGGFFGGNPWVFGVARLNANGSLDMAFGSGGKLTTQFNGSDLVTAILIQTDGKIIAVGQTLDPNTGRAKVALARYLGQ